MSYTFTEIDRSLGTSDTTGITLRTAGAAAGDLLLVVACCGANATFATQPAITTQRSAGGLSGSNARPRMHVYTMVADGSAPDLVWTLSGVAPCWGVVYKLGGFHRNALDFSGVSTPPAGNSASIPSIAVPAGGVAVAIVAARDGVNIVGQLDYDFGQTEVLDTLAEADRAHGIGIAYREYAGATTAPALTVDLSDDTTNPTINFATVRAAFVPTTTTAGVPYDDEFDGAALEAYWADEDPLGDCSIDTGDAATLKIVVPGGTAHDLFTGIFDVPRVVQSIGDLDLDLTCKLANLPVAGQLAGIIVKGAGNDWVRFNHQHSAGTGRVYCATIDNGTATARLGSGGAVVTANCLRLTRVGATWTLYASTDGVSWGAALATFTFATTVTHVGLFAGNFGTTPPAYAPSFEWFRAGNAYADGGGTPPYVEWIEIF